MDRKTKMGKDAYKLKMFVDEKLSIPFDGGIDASPGEKGVMYVYIANLSDKKYTDFSLETKDPIKTKNLPYTLNPGDKRKVEFLFKMPKDREPEFTITYNVRIPPTNPAETMIISDRILNKISKKTVCPDCGEVRK